MAIAIDIDGKSEKMRQRQRQRERDSMCESKESPSIFTIRRIVCVMVIFKGMCNSLHAIRFIKSVKFYEFIYLCGFLLTVFRIKRSVVA